MGRTAASSDQKSIVSFRKRLQNACINAKGGQFGHCKMFSVKLVIGISIFKEK